jgi:protein-S-isoprenylcysteine O-methyltransferase Ste14
MTDWRDVVFKNRGALLVSVALALLVFGRPSGVSALVGICIALMGEALRIWAVGYSGVTTRAGVVTAPALVTAGPYAVVRNPLYLGNTIIALGFWFALAGALPWWLAALLLIFVLAAVGGVYGVIIPHEERYLAKTFGPQYSAYMVMVPRIFPRGAGLPRSEQTGRWSSAVIARAEVITLLFFALMVAAVLLKLGPLQAWTIGS